MLPPPGFKTHAKNGQPYGDLTMTMPDYEHAVKFVMACSAAQDRGLILEAGDYEIAVDTTRLVRLDGLRVTFGVLGIRLPSSSPARARAQGDGFGDGALLATTSTAVSGNANTGG